MEIKEIGTQHGAVVRSKVSNVALFARGEAAAYGRVLARLGNHGQRAAMDTALFARDVAVDSAKLAWFSARFVGARAVEIAVPAAKGAEHKAKQAGAYVTGFAQGLVRSGNV